MDFARLCGLLTVVAGRCGPATAYLFRGGLWNSFWFVGGKEERMAAAAALLGRCNSFSLVHVGLARAQSSSTHLEQVPLRNAMNILLWPVSGWMHLDGQMGHKLGRRPFM